MELLNNVTDERRELAGGITKYRVVRDAHRTVCSERSLMTKRAGRAIIVLRGPQFLEGGGSPRLPVDPR